jgi:hypothetical protein
VESAAYVSDEVEARLLADIFSPRRGSIPTRAPTRSSKPAATKLLANLLPAAAVANRPITLVYLWLTDPTEDEAVEILCSDGYDLVAAACGRSSTRPSSAAAYTAPSSRSPPPHQSPSRAVGRSQQLRPPPV